MILLSVLLALAALVLVGLPYALARLVTSAGTRPRDRALTSSPADYGLAFEDVTFESADGLRLSGWYLGGGDGRLSVACGHGLFRSRREVLARAAFFREQGFDTLVFDFRHHGESEGERVTLGYQERLDFLGAVRYLRERHPDREVVLYGVSMGAAAALLAAAEEPEVAAAVVDSPFLSFEQTVVHHVDLLFGLPRFPFASVLMFFLEQRGGFDRADFDMEKAAAAMGERPILVIAGDKDRRMPAPLQKRVYQASSSPASRFEIFAAGHGHAYEQDPERYRALLSEFLRPWGVPSPHQN